MFNSPMSQIISFAYTKHFFYIFNTHEDKKWNANPVVLPDNFTLVSDNSVTASPLIDKNYDLIILFNELLENTAIEYAKKLNIPILVIQNGHKYNFVHDMTVYTTEKNKLLYGGNDSDYVYDSIIIDQHEDTIKDFSQRWNEILDKAAKII